MRDELKYFGKITATAFLILVGASKCALEYHMGVDSPTSRLTYWMSDDGRWSEEDYQEELKENRDRVIDIGKWRPTLAKIVGLPYSLRYEEYWSKEERKN